MLIGDQRPVVLTRTERLRACAAELTTGELMPFHASTAGLPHDGHLAFQVRVELRAATRKPRRKSSDSAGCRRLFTTYSGYLILNGPGAMN